MDEFINLTNNVAATFDQSIQALFSSIEDIQSGDIAEVAINMSIEVS